MTTRPFRDMPTPMLIAVLLVALVVGYETWPFQPHVLAARIEALEKRVAQLEQGR